MAAKALDKSIAATIVAEWRTGEYSQQDLADRHNVSKGKINNLCKGVTQDTAAIVTAGVEYRCGLAAHDDRNVTAVTEVIDKRVKHIQFFDDCAVRNVNDAMCAPCEGQNDFRARADTISKGREVVLGKQVDTAIQINNNQPEQKEQLPPREVARRIAFALSLGMRDSDSAGNGKPPQQH